MPRLALLLALFPSVGFAATLTVGPTGTYATIQAAVNNANNGDVIEVEPGVYPETLFIDVNIDIVGTGGSGSTAVAGAGAQTIEVDGANLGLEGLTLTPNAGRALVIYGGSNVNALDLVIDGFDSSILGGGSDGGAMEIFDSNFGCTNCVLSNNVTNDDGGFLDAVNSDLFFDSVDIVGNRANDVAGAMRVNGGSLTISNSWVSSNRADGSGNTVSGGAIVLDNATGTFTSTNFDDNFAIADGAGIRAIAGSSLTVDDCTFSRNLADNNYGDDHGGAIDLLDSSVTVLDSIFSDNRALERGGAIYGGDFSTIFVSNSTFRGNNTNEDGGAIDALQGTDVFIETSTFTDNVVANGLGGAIHVVEDGILEITDSTFEGNSANLGGAIYSQDDTVVLSSVFLDNTCTSNGGAIRWFSNDGDSPFLLVEDSLFSGNDAGGNGGAIAAWQIDYYAQLGFIDVTDSKFYNNIASGSGGAVWSDGHQGIQARRNYFCANEAGVDGGAVFLQETASQFNVWTNNVLNENNAAILGGGMAAVQTGFLDLVNNNLLSNDAVSGGGLYATQTDYDFRNNIVSWTVGGDGLQSDGTQGSRDYNLWFDNLAADAGGALGAGDLGGNAVFADPMFENYSADGVCFNDIYVLMAGSPAIDAGDPGLDDIDGSPSDIGAYGGPDAPPELLEDLDNDGYLGVADCDDNNPAVNPGEPEVCDGVDNNCDGLVDDASAPGAVDWWLDSDGDGSGDANNVITACYPPAGYVANDGDCDDVNPNIGLYAAEECNGIDDNCDGQIDEGFTPTDWFPDADGDGYGDDGGVVTLCDAPAGFIATGGDCNDSDDTINPDASEVCDGFDNNCDAQIDEGFSPTDWFPDADGDGYGDDASVQTLCDPPPGWIDVGGDCADGQAEINPGATEECDTVDNNCDGQVDEGLTTTWYPDADGDGFGDISAAEDLCDQPSPDATDVGGDCNDNDADVNPDAEEICDGIDNNCDESVDEDLFQTWYRDADGDAYGTDQDFIDDCEQPQGYVDADGDCDDTNPEINPAMSDDYRDQIDQNCDGSDGLPFADEALAAISDCGCANTGSAPGAGWLGAVVLLLLRRRS